jgi:hypothetical protein
MKWQLKQLKSKRTIRACTAARKIEKLPRKKSLIATINCKARTTSQFKAS